MAPVNGVAGKPAKTAARPPSRTIVPVLPLNYPQRPANKQSSAPATTSSPKKGQNGVRPADEKPASHVLKHNQEQPNGNSTSRGPDPANNPGAAAPSATPVQTTAKAGASDPVLALDELEKDTPTIASTFPDRRMASHGHHRPPPGFPNPALEPMGASAPVPEAPIPAPVASIMNRPAFHQPHPSNGSLMFNGFYDSGESSPAPRSGGGFPPPGLLPYPMPTVDGYGRPLLVSPAAVDGFPPNPANHHGPPTPHSFQGSQSSTQADEHGFSHYPAVNGHAGHLPTPAGPGPMPPPGMNPAMNGTVHHASGSVSAYQSLRDQDEALSFLRHGISDNTFNDCMLEVRFPDSPEFQDHPDYRQLHHVLRTHGHRFVYSRSPMLAGVMKAQGTMPGSAIFLEVSDEYMRLDVFWYSLRTLYGWSLADGILPTDLRLRDVRDDLKTALSYIATARYLQLPWVHSVAVHRANRLLFWNTIEVAVKFVSQIVAMAPRNDGFGMSELVDQVLSFIVHNFPVDFVLDLDAGDYGFLRFPPSSPAQRNPNAPTIANGTSSGLHSRQPSKNQTQMPRHPRMSSNLRLSQIKFGDISPPRDGQVPSAPTLNDTILSRILLNLPFELLKRALEHPHLAKLSGDLNPASRQSIISEIIIERESRRLRVLEKADPQLRVYQDRVENATGPLVVGNMDDFWINSMGFKEEVFPGDLPYLVHTWSQATSSNVST
ncbi:hypothetical protein C8A00DRAFT_46007 [Chaetomidium leptoderma]|uniref:Uncharacterized protein n=1 Tax=Chaetomidium leptoderma TaxID=669021 RepID=A0AAN6ZVR7_9PEZI|nr:hypothetical protein C8A00DRAFT_46007 [Chaetomidium leptoderma]